MGAQNTRDDKRRCVRGNEAQVRLSLIGLLSGSNLQEIK